MTYRELQAVLSGLTDEELDCDMVVHDMDGDEYHPVAGVGVDDTSDVLDAGHPYLFY